MFYADLHVHSKYSRATSRDCDLEHLALWAAKKGIAVVATGDFTHPGWLEELEEKLVPAEPGLYRLRPDLEAQVRQELPPILQGEVRFLLQVEISTIYKKRGQTRKVHHVLYVPQFQHARRLVQSLGRVGNLNSDGRPILGLDARDLLEITLQSGDGAFLVPAHIWTPWFSALGSKSGFDAIEECYGDLSGEVFALETGLSSDPPMNWRLSALDRYALVSNSDAHSPSKLGREACVFDTPLDYFAMRRALERGEGYAGTVEFFPEEGKYHLDGHRKCGVCLEPPQTQRYGGLCPACGKPLTLGVMYRVEELADRPAPPNPLPARAAPLRSFIPLEEILAELLGVGAQSKSVAARYEALIGWLGPELSLLEHAPLEAIAQRGSPVLAEAISRMRSGRVIRQAGYDGQYGVIRLFTKDELRRQSGAGLLFELPEPPIPASARTLFEGAPLPTAVRERSPLPLAGEGQRRRMRGDESAPGALGVAVNRRLPLTADSPLSTLHSPCILDQLDPDQRAAAELLDGPVLIVAGPGTGKTRTLTHRLAHLIADCGARPEQCLALTFSRRAAGEMAERLRRLLPQHADRVPVMTFHAFGLSVLREHGNRLGLPPSVRVASQADRAEMLAQALALSQAAAGQLLARIARHKRRSPEAQSAQEPDDATAMAAYHQELESRGWVDFDDLILLPLRLLADSPELVDRYRAAYRWVSVDEYQDIDASQYALIKRLVPPNGNLCAIGDPDQAIYGFRGSDHRYFQQFAHDFPTARTIRLQRSYRSTQTIVDAALQLIAPSSLVADRRLEANGLGPEQIEIHSCATERAEAEFVVHSIERLLGGSTFFSLDSDRVASFEGEGLSLADFAVLYRTDAQAGPLVEALARSGMPFQRHCHDPLAERPLVQAAVRAITCGQTKPQTHVPVLELLDQAAARLEENAGPEPAVWAALRSLAERHGNDLGGFLSELALGTDVDLWDARADRISLLTLHAAKGLEFPVVFIVGCEDGLLPLHFGSIDPETLAEERRLLFVGMTRAQQRLILTHARKRLWKGRLRVSSPSPFLADIQRELLAYHQHQAIKRPAPVDRQRTLFE